MYLRRKVDTFLSEWKNDSNRKPLIIRGARQVGKSESIRRFAQGSYTHVIEINFVEEPKYKNIISDGFSPADIIKNISLLDPKKRFVEGETLLFFDELQDFPEITTALKFFHVDGQYDIICSGSMLGMNYKQIESNSVGYKTDYLMSSLDFEEFLWAKEYDEPFITNLLTHMIEEQPFSDTQMSVFHSLFLDFTILGGMPAIIRDFIEKGTFEGSLAAQRQLLADYRDDVRKYAQGMDQSRILNVFDHIPVQLAKENKKFQISKVAKGARFQQYRGCLDWLNDAGIINICYCLEFPELPLKGNYNEKKQKVYLADTGLLVAMLDEEAQEDLRAHKNLGVYKGALYENIVAEALVKSGYSLYYYSRDDSTLEEDFFVRTAASLIPVEVKSRGGRSKSLRTLIQSRKYSDISYGIKFHAGNIGFSNEVYSFPYFCAFLLKRYLKHKSQEILS